jgi:hypothetical protein
MKSIVKVIITANRGVIASIYSSEKDQAFANLDGGKPLLQSRYRSGQDND